MTVHRCILCRLHETRKRIVDGVGPEHATIMLVGEAPGADEDAAGVPFVGAAGKLLDEMIEAMKLRRADLYITNVCKCRPPGNRTPYIDEIEACRPWLMQEVRSVQPRVIVAMGRTAAQTLLHSSRGINALRGRDHEWKGRIVVATYHPAYALPHRSPESKTTILRDLHRAVYLAKE